MANANDDWDESTSTIDTVITYTCTTSGGETFTSVCQGDGMWSEISGTCTDTTTPAGKKSLEVVLVHVNLFLFFKNRLYI